MKALIWICIGLGMALNGYSESIFVKFKEDCKPFYKGEIFQIEDSVYVWKDNRATPINKKYIKPDHYQLNDMIEIKERLGSENKWKGNEITDSYLKIDSLYEIIKDTNVLAQVHFKDKKNGDRFGLGNLLKYEKVRVYSSDKVYRKISDSLVRLNILEDIGSVTETKQKILKGIVRERNRLYNRSGYPVFIIHGGNKSLVKKDGYYDCSHLEADANLRFYVNGYPSFGIHLSEIQENDVFSFREFCEANWVWLLVVGIVILGFIAGLCLFRKNKSAHKKNSLYAEGEMHTDSWDDGTQLPGKHQVTEKISMNQGKSKATEKGTENDRNPKMEELSKKLDGMINSLNELTQLYKKDWERPDKSSSLYAEFTKKIQESSKDQEKMNKVSQLEREVNDLQKSKSNQQNEIGRLNETIHSKEELLLNKDYQIEILQKEVKKAVPVGTIRISGVEGFTSLATQFLDKMKAAEKEVIGYVKELSEKDMEKVSLYLSDFYCKKPLDKIAEWNNILATLDLNGYIKHPIKSSIENETTNEAKLNILKNCFFTEILRPYVSALILLLERIRTSHYFGVSSMAPNAITESIHSLITLCKSMDISVIYKEMFSNLDLGSHEFDNFEIDSDKKYSGLIVKKDGLTSDTIIYIQKYGVNKKGETFEKTVCLTYTE